jgi:hypothetical protein
MNRLFLFIHGLHNEINPGYNKRNTQQLSHIQRQIGLKGRLKFLDELNEKTGSENQVKNNPNKNPLFKPVPYFR